jgi:putrescine transport system substrate-binding protein
MKRIFLFLAVIFSIFILIAIFTPSSGVQKKDDNVLYIYSWSGSSDQEVIKQFEKETGIKVVIDFYDSNDVLEAKLLTGKTNYDIVFPSVSPNYIRQIGMGIYTPLDKEKLTNYQQLDPKIMKLIAKFDVGNQFGVPYAMGTTGLGYVESQVNKALPEGIPNSLQTISVMYFFSPSLL